MKKKLLLIIAVMFVFTLFTNVHAVEKTAAEIPNDSYVVGTHLFTRDPAEGSPYEGTLTTQWIMEASKTDDIAVANKVIYYKALRGNSWSNAINDEDIEAPASFNIEYINGVQSVEVPVPTIAQDMNSAGAGAPEYPDLVVVNGQVCALIHLENAQELTGLVDGFVVYNAADDSVVENKTNLTDHVRVCGDQGTTGTYYAKAYKNVSNAPVYSEKSTPNVEIEFDMALPLPELAQDMNSAGAGAPEYPDIEVSDGQICALMHLNNAQDLESDVSGFVVYNAADDSVVETTDDLTAHIRVCGNPGDEKAYYAKTYKSSDEDTTKLYSEKSTPNVEIEFEISIPTPVIEVASQPAPYIKLFGLTNASENTYCSTVGNERTCSIDGIEFYIKNAGNYELANLQRETTDSLSYALFDIIGQPAQTYAVRAYKMIGSTKVYSEYSNELNLSMTVPTPDLSIQEFSCGAETCDLDVGSGITDASYYYKPEEGSGDEPVYYYDYMDVFKEGVAEPILTYVPTGGVRTIRDIEKGAENKYYAKAFTVYRFGFANLKVYSAETEHKTVTAPRFLEAPIEGVFYAGQDYRPLTYILGIDASHYCAEGTSEQCDKYEIDGFEIYEKVGNTYVPANLPYEDGTNNGPLDAHIFDTVGERKRFVARVYSLYGENNSLKNYSDYSYELVLDNTLLSPNMAYGGEMECENGTCSIAICITNSSDYIFLTAEENGEDVYMIDHYDVVSVDGEESHPGIELGSCVRVTGTQGVPKTYTIKPYLTRNGVKHYDPYPTEYTVDF